MLQSATVVWLRQELEAGSLTRNALARGLCEREKWRNARGQLCAASAHKALPRLARELRRALPPPRRAGPAAPRAAGALPEPRVAGELAALGTLHLRRVDSRPERAVWRRMLRECHPRGESRAPGVRVTYLLDSERYGVIGGLSFVAAPWHCAARDDEIGWSERARVAHLARVARNDRFLLLPGVQVPNLASRALALARRQLPDDWQARAGQRPLLLETCVDPAWAGTCYEAAGWRKARRPTSGRPPGAAAPVAPKALWLLPLAADWQQQLCREPPRPAGRWPSATATARDFAAFEYGRSDLVDGRLRRRLECIGGAWARAPEQPLAERFPSAAAQKGLQRFLHNKRVQCEDVLQPHREALLERARREGTVLVVQDTTAINLNHLKDCASGLGSIGSGSRKAVGLWMHACVAFAPGGRPLGVLSLEMWARQPGQGQQEREQRESARWLRGFEAACELGRLCPGTRVVAVGDREADMHELFRLQRERRAEAGLLVRASRGAQRRCETRQGRACLVQDLWQLVETREPLVTDRQVPLLARGGKEARRARTMRTELRAAVARLRPPQRCRQDGPLELLAVQARDAEAGQDSDCEWMLLCSEGGPDAAGARQAVAWYETRWRIEEFFKTLKSGAHAELRQLQDFESICKALAFDAITATRVFALREAAREAPEQPAAAVLSEEEIDGLEALARCERLLPRSQRGRERPQTVRDAVVLLGRLAGFVPSKRQPLPGQMKLWRGWVALHSALRGIRAWRAPP